MISLRSNLFTLNGKGMPQKCSSPWTMLCELVAPTDPCQPGHSQTVSHIINSCPFRFQEV